MSTINSKNKYSLEAQSAFLDVPTAFLTKTEKNKITEAGFCVDLFNSPTVYLPLIWCKNHLSKAIIQSSNLDFDLVNFQNQLAKIILPTGKYLMRINNTDKTIFKIVSFDDIFNRFCEKEEWLIYSDYFTAVFWESSGKKERNTIALTRVNEEQATMVDDECVLDIFMDVRLQAAATLIY